MIGLPKDTDPSKLLLTLLEWRPRAAMSSRLSVAPDLQLYTRAITSRERRILSGSMAIVSACLVDAAGESVVSAEAAGYVDSAEWSAVTFEVARSLDRICPMYGSHNSREYVDALKIALQRDPIQRSALCLCFDTVIPPWGGKRELYPRPDRYWGKPMTGLLDGHMMVFQAVKETLQK